MSLENILLGMLGEPASGYDLKARFNEGPRYFWPAELSQIYPTLQKLEKNGKLASSIEPSRKGPPRRVYRRTPEGRKQLLNWLKSGPQLGTERFAYLGQLTFMHELEDLEATTEFILELRAKLFSVLAILKQAEQQLPGGDNSRYESLADDELHGYLSMRMGIHSLTARVAWCDEALEQLQARSQLQVVPDRSKQPHRKEKAHG